MCYKSTIFVVTNVPNTNYAKCLGFLSDRVKEILKAQRATIFVIDDVTQEMFFIIDTPSGKTEAPIPLNPIDGTRPTSQY